MQQANKHGATPSAGCPDAVDALLTEAQSDAIAGQLDWARDKSIVQRIWAADHTVWKPSPEGITDRLGWLRIVGQMLELRDELELFADEVRSQGFSHCVLLGMGGSSLAAEVMLKAFGVRSGYLKLHVLDTTDPDTVNRLAADLPLDKTLFLVSSKSGGTLETMSLFKFFRGKVGNPSQFVAITDPGSPLAELAAQEGFKKTFLNSADIGGRYSALSYFGLVPAALIGADLGSILESANDAAARSAKAVDTGCSAGLWLGCAIGALALQGRDKLTFACSEPLASFGLWLEQLLAESTGKEGRGIVPIEAEPLGDASDYGNDRVFVNILNGAALDQGEEEKLKALADAGHPVFTVPFSGATDIGAQFILWQFATAIASAVIGVNPFDQPNVQEAKDLTDRQIGIYLDSGQIDVKRDPTEKGATTVISDDESLKTHLSGLLGQASAGSYISILAYIPYGDDIEHELEKIRKTIFHLTEAPITIGYGPRYLHSTGQLHKGGSPKGVFLQINHNYREGVSIPGSGYDFGTLISAQAEGDLEALKSRSLPVISIQLGDDVVAGLQVLEGRIAEAFSQTAPGDS